MHLCYIDESGTSAVPGNTSHFVLAGISIPVWHWNSCDRQLNAIKRRFGLEDAEIHTAWILRRYLEQSKIANFERLTYENRRREVERYRNAHLLQLQRANNQKKYKQTRKNYLKTHDYIHLTEMERRAFIDAVADCVAGWGSARLFAECIDKVYFDPVRTARSIDEQAFEQLVSRFEQYLATTETVRGHRNFGLMIHDNNDTVAKKHTEMMKSFHIRGTLWTDVERIIETPLFVDSQLTGLVQIADLCSYAIRRYLENQEEDLFLKVFPRADRRGPVVVGMRHFTDNGCTCTICDAH